MERSSSSRPRALSVLTGVLGAVLLVGVLVPLAGEILAGIFLPAHGSAAMPVRLRLGHSMIRYCTPTEAKILQAAHDRILPVGVVAGLLLLVVVLAQRRAWGRRKF